MQTAPRCQWGSSEHRRYCQHHDWLEAFWTGLIDRHARCQTQAALCVEPEVNAMSIVGFFRRARGVNSVRSLPFAGKGFDGFRLLYMLGA